MRLVPLLGASAPEKLPLNTASLVDLQTITPTQHPQRLEPLPNKAPEPDSEESDSEADDLSAIRVEVNQTDTELSKDVTASSSSLLDGPFSYTDNVRAKLMQPRNSLRVRPRRAKRMKLRKSELGIIEESLDERRSRSSSVCSTNRMLLPLPDLLDSLSREPVKPEDREAFLEEKRRDIALMRKVNYAPKSTKQSSQIAMQSHAKKKFRKLPPIPTGL